MAGTEETATRAMEAGTHGEVGIIGCNLVAVDFGGSGWGVHEGGVAGKRIGFYGSRDEAVARIEAEYASGLYVTNWTLWREMRAAGVDGDG